MNKLLLLALTFILSGCGTLTGLPGHGGGKRFAVEQELVSGTVRAAIKDLDVSNLKGKKVTIFINAIGDAGSGNITGGRYSLQALLRGEVFNGVPTVETSTYPILTTVTSSNTDTTTSSQTDENARTVSGATSSSTGTTQKSDTSRNAQSTETRQQVAPGPSRKEVDKSGVGATNQFGMQYKGIGSYLNSDRISSKDTLFLSAAFQTYLFLKGVHIVPPSEAQVDIYLTVDVFGTIRSRVDWLAANNEVLMAKTSLEMMAVDHNTGEIVSPPQVSSYEAEYNEQYVLWAGPIEIKKYLRKSDGLLSDYTDLSDDKSENEKEVSLMYPFKERVKKYKEKKRK